MRRISRTTRIHHDPAPRPSHSHFAMPLQPRWCGYNTSYLHRPEDQVARWMIEDMTQAPHFDDQFRAMLTDLLIWRRDVRRFRPDPLPRFDS